VTLRQRNIRRGWADLPCRDSKYAPRA